MNASIRALNAADTGLRRSPVHRAIATSGGVGDSNIGTRRKIRRYLGAMAAVGCRALNVDAVRIFLTNPELQGLRRWHSRIAATGDAVLSKE